MRSAEVLALKRIKKLFGREFISILQQRIEFELLYGPLPMVLMSPDGSCLTVADDYFEVQSFHSLGWHDLGQL